MRPPLRFMLALVPVWLAAAAPAHAQDATLYVVRYIEVAPGDEAKTAGLLKQLAEASRKEAGNQRFEVLQRISPADQFATFEIWKDKEAQDAHLAAAHTKSFTDAVQASLLGPIDDRPCIAADAAALMPASGDARYVITHVDFAPPQREICWQFITSRSATLGGGRFTMIMRKRSGCSKCWPNKAILRHNTT